MRFYLLDADYVIENGAPLIRLFGVDREGRSICVMDTHEPYLYAVPTKFTKEVKGRILKIKDPKVKRVEAVKRKIGSEDFRTGVRNTSNAHAFEERDVLKVYAFLPADVPNLRDALKRFKEIGHDGCYEYTVNFYKRYLIDRGFAPGAWYDVEGDVIEKKRAFGTIVLAKSIAHSKSLEKAKTR